MEKALAGNIWKYTLLLIANKRIFVAILGAYYLTIPGVDAEWIGILLFAGSLSGFLFEIPSGYVSDKLGHKKALVIARVLMLLSTLFFLVADSIPLLILGSVFLSLSLAFQSGTGDAFMHETLRALGREDDYARVMGKASSIGFAVPIVFMVLVPFLVSVSYRAPFAIALIIDIIGICAALVLMKPPVTQEHIDEVNATNFRQVMREGHQLHFFRHALFLGIVSGILFGIGAFRPVYQALLGIPVIWFGVLFGIGRAFASLMLAYSGSIRIFMKHSHRYHGFQLVLYTALIFILGVTSIPWVVATVFIIINAFMWGLSQVSSGYLLDIIKGSKFKATLLSTRFQIEALVGAVSGLGMGLLFSQLSYQRGFLYLAIVFFVTLLPLYIFIIRRSATFRLLNKGRS
jgi:MFS family permease